MYARKWYREKENILVKKRLYILLALLVMMANVGFAQSLKCTPNPVSLSSPTTTQCTLRYPAPPSQVTSVEIWINGSTYYRQTPNPNGGTIPPSPVPMVPRGMIPTPGNYLVQGVFELAGTRIFIASINLQVTK
jgi:hypothetical protein